MSQTKRSPSKMHAKGSKGITGNLELRGKITPKMVAAYHSRTKTTTYSPKQVNEIGGTT